jgi:hypothetical protein
MNAGKTKGSGPDMPGQSEAEHICDEFGQLRLAALKKQPATIYGRLKRWDITYTDPIPAKVVEKRARGYALFSFLFGIFTVLIAVGALFCGRMMIFPLLFGVASSMTSLFLGSLSKTIRPEKEVSGPSIDNVGLVFGTFGLALHSLVIIGWLYYISTM